MILHKEASIDWVLRIAIFGEFLGHGVFALQGKAQWTGWISELLHVDLKTAATLLFVIGICDIALALAILFWRRIPKALLLWAAIWGFWTALLRPVMGEPIWDFIERWANWGAPLALILLRDWPHGVKEWFVKK